MIEVRVPMNQNTSEVCVPNHRPILTSRTVPDHLIAASLARGDASDNRVGPLISSPDHFQYFTLFRTSSD
jgi:hypothetical protein